MRSFIFAAAVCLVFNHGSPAAEIPVGVAAVDITPEHPIRLNGFSFRHDESKGVRQQIWAKALAIGSDQDGPSILITCDTLGIPDLFVQQLAERLKNEAGIEPARLAVTATHTHTGPMVNNVSPTLFGIPIPPEHQRHIDQYTATFQEALYQAAIIALKDRRPATLAWGMGQVGFAANRRNAGGPVDHDLPVLVARSPDGRVRAVYVSYACHCVSLSDYQISGDWAGYAQEHIQRAHPGSVALVSIGCGADANPSTGVVGDKAEIAEKHGLEIADEVNRLLANPLAPLSGAPIARLERLVLPLAPLPTREEWQRRAGADSDIGHHARTQLARLDRGEPLTTEISYPVQTWSFGDDLALVFLPGEVVVDYSLRLKRELDSRRIWVNGYANGCPGYVPSERILREGGYEGGGAMIYYDLPGPYAPGLEDKIIAAVRGQLAEHFSPPADSSKTQGSLPLAAEQSLLALRARPGFTVDLVASEPLIASPVAIDFGADGRLWVAEMYDYPAGPDNNYTPGGRIKVLDDLDHDGRYDRATTFLDSIPFPTGVTVWRDGVLISAAPDLLYARDTDADGRADQVEKLYSGFATHNYQGRVNSLHYGLDGWVYGACGLFGGDITNHRDPQPLALGRRDFRILPDDRVMEPAAGSTQQGRARDDWGNWFGCNSGSLIDHYPLADHYLRRNPALVPPGSIVGIAGGPNSQRVFSIAQTVRFKLSGPADNITAACGLGIYRDELLGPEYRGNAFTCEPVNNLVHRRLLKPSGVTFQALRAEDELDREFLASTDPWFRPVQVRTGADGALWVVDMYRYVIEHPIWIPPETLSQLDVRAGAEMGRIYRVYPRDRPPRKPTRLDQLQPAQLVDALDSPNGQQRDLAQQRLLWLDDRARVVEQTAARLERLARHGARPETRLHALCTLSLLGALKPSALTAALVDEHPGVRRHAVRLAEPLLSESRQLGDALLAIAGDADPQVQLQLAYTLGQWPDQRAARALAAMALAHSQDAYLTAAVFSSLNARNIQEVFRAAWSSEKGRDAAAQAIEQLFVHAAALGDDALVAELLRELIDPGRSQRRGTGFQFTAVSSTLAALERNQRPLDRYADKALRSQLDQLVIRARRAAGDPQTPDPTRVAAIHLLARASSGSEVDADLAANLLVPRNSPEVQSAAVAALARWSPDDLPGRLLAGWPSHGPQLRGQVLDLLISRETWLDRLLDELERANQRTEGPPVGIHPADIDLVRQQRLAQHADPHLKQRALDLFEQPGAAGRQQIVQQYAAALELQGDAARGRPLFEKHCAACHRLQDIGQTVGPDLGPYTAKPPQAMLIAVLDPNQAVDPRYHGYTVTLLDGRVLTGAIMDETATSLTLISPEGRPQPVLRTDIDELANSGKSLMPEGFERELSQQQLADLFAWVLARPIPKALAGNQPGLVPPGEGGGLVLSADKAEVYGGDITFEESFGNIGHWHGAQDHVRWRFELERPSTLDVWIEWSCAPYSAGNAFNIQCGDGRLDHSVESTGGWDVYRQAHIGSLDLPAGPAALVLRPAGPLASALMDLRAVHLVPPGASPPPLKTAAAEPIDPATLARYLLNDARSAGQRERRIQQTTGVAAEVLAVMVADLTPGTGEASRNEEYRRIPWMWRVAIAAGRRNDPAELSAVLATALPRPGETMHDWQAVVVGGGVINGLSLSGDWPRARIESLLESLPQGGGRDALIGRWRRCIELAVQMADDQATAIGTRYDALRIVAMQDLDRCGEQLRGYLGKDSHEELQMGAVSGLADIPSDAAAEALLERIADFSDQNRGLALDALLRTPARARLLRDALSRGAVTAEQLGPDRTRKLHELTQQATKPAND